MGDKKQAEWLANADVCRKMAERLKQPELRARWLRLAQEWLTLCEPAPEPQNATQQFEAAIHDRGTGQKSSDSSN